MEETKPECFTEQPHTREESPDIAQEFLPVGHRADQILGAEYVAREVANRRANIEAHKAQRHAQGKPKDPLHRLLHRYK